MPGGFNILRTWAPAGVVLLAIAVSSVGLEAGPAETPLIAAVFPPWWPPGRVLRAAAGAGDVLGFGATPSIVIIHGPATRLAARARAHGALLTFARTRQGLCTS